MIARAAGRVLRCAGDAVVATLPGARVGDAALVRPFGAAAVPADVTAVARGRAWLAPAGPTHGVAAGDRVEAGGAPGPACGTRLLGRALDAAGTPLDGRGPILRELGGATSTALAPDPSERRPVRQPFATGIAAIDALLTIGRGARIGIFGPPGTGKSTLLEAITAGAEADAVVLGLVGERGREAECWIRRVDARTTIVCATSDRLPAERVRAAALAMRQAEVLRARGLHVLLVLDSLARYATALRERRTALREAVGRGGYPPGVWSELAAFVERPGATVCGSITLVATILSEADDDRDPLAEAARSLLDGHVILSPALGRAGRFPAIDVLASASRTMTDVADARHLRDASRVRAALARLAATAEARDLGLHAAPDPALAAALAAEPAIEAFLRARAPLDRAAVAARLAALAEALGPASLGGPA